ncbi:MAG: family 78 glycoside hydrolase catalytic domain [Bacteroidales bacterium]|nr:family 78 glycoside hydrolase catalytic domain [Bacteroidales bacterium]
MNPPRLTICCLLTLLLAGPLAALTPVRLTCEWLEQPLLVETATPCLGWELALGQSGSRQSAYQVLVAASPEEIAAFQTQEATPAAKGASTDKQLLWWNSGKVLSDQSQQVPYAGSNRLAGTTYYWTVRVWDENGKVSDWAPVHRFDRAPAPSVMTASWIGALTKAQANLPQGRDWHGPSFKQPKVKAAFEAINPLALRSIQLRKSFHLSQRPTKAMLYVSALGHGEVTLNGNRVGDAQFEPLWSDYDKTVYYSAYDLTGQLKPGEQVLGVLLGNGFYNSVGNRYRKLWVSFGPPTLFLQLHLTYADGSQSIIRSDESWHYALSPITFNDIFGGEDYDATLEQPGWDRPGFVPDSCWQPVVIQEAPKGQLTPSLAPPVKVMDNYPVQQLKRIKHGVYLLDMGQNLSGFPAIRVKGPKGAVVKLVVGELLSGDTAVSQKRSGGPHYYSYTLRGEGEESWQPRFSYYGYRFIQLEGADFLTPEPGSDLPVVTAVTSRFIHNSTYETGRFACSNNLFNQVYGLIHMAVKSNFQAVFTDCPHREKLGWLEQNHLNGPALFMTYDLAPVTPKMVRDMVDAQRPNGLIPSIAPEYVVFDRDFSDSPEWGVAGVMVPWLYYTHYGDIRMLEQAYPMMKRYVDYLGSCSKDGIVSHGLGDWYDYGPHAAGYSKNTPIALSATAHYYLGLTYVAKTAKLLGHKADAASYKALATAVKKAYNKTFFNPETNQYATGSQYANAVSIYLDLVPAKKRAAVLANLVANIKQNGYRLTTGDVGNRYLFMTLAENGLNDLMYTMQNHTDVPGYGYQVAYGVTTLTEQWDPKRGNSWNHFMLGQIDEWFYRSLAGLKPDPNRPGFQHFLVEPQPAGDLTWVEASYQSPYGLIDLRWERNDQRFQLDLQVPANCTARVKLPVSGKPVFTEGSAATITRSGLELGPGFHQLYIEYPLSLKH